MFGFNPTNSADVNLNADSDSLSNGAEYVAGTDSANALSHLRIERPAFDRGIVILHFFAVSNQTDAVEASDVVGGPWNSAAEVVAVSTNRIVTVPDPQPRAAKRVYRLVTPRTN